MRCGRNEREITHISATEQRLNSAKIVTMNKKAIFSKNVIFSALEIDKLIKYGRNERHYISTTEAWQDRRKKTEERRQDRERRKKTEE